MEENVNIIQLYTYTLFGQVHSSSGSISQPYQYVGGEGYYTEQDINLQLLGQRWYNAEVGRFISRDPMLSLQIWKNNIVWLIPSSIKQPLLLNSYGYVSNNSLVYIDPEGYFKKISIDWKLIGRRIKEFMICLGEELTSWDTYQYFYTFCSTFCAICVLGKHSFACGTCVACIGGGAYWFGCKLKECWEKARKVF